MVEIIDFIFKKACYQLFRRYVADTTFIIYGLRFHQRYEFKTITNKQINFSQISKKTVKNFASRFPSVIVCKK